MTIRNNFNVMNNAQYPYYGGPSFRENYQPAQIITKPIEKVEKIVNNTVDTFVPEETQNEEEKKSKKTAIKVISTVGVLSVLVMLLNPKSLGKLSEKMKTWSAKAGNKAKVNDSFLGKLYSTGQKGLEKFSKFLNILNNLNTSKDEGFKWLCTANKNFSKIKNDSLRKFAEKFDKGFVKIMKKPHEVITGWFDAISKQTVYNKYRKVNNDMKLLDEILTKYKDKLPAAERIQLQVKLDEIKETQAYFQKDGIAQRLKNQEQAMSSLEEKARKRIKSYGKTMWNGEQNRAQYFKNNLDFWAESIVMNERNKIEQDGLQTVQSLVGDGKEIRGKYGEILDILSPHIKKEEQSVLEGSIKKLGKKMNKANHTECIEYFDKKRDLILGSAPTDILTALGGLAFSGVMIGTADDKQERISRTVTLALPVFAGLGVSMATAAALYSGGTGLAVGAASSLGLNKIGSTIDKKFVRKDRPEVQAEVQSA